MHYAFDNSGGVVMSLCVVFDDTFRTRCALVSADSITLIGTSYFVSTII